MSEGSEGGVVLVTGAARRLGGRFVRRIQRDPAVRRVVAVDAVPPEHELGDAEFVRADIRQPMIAKVLAQHSVDTVVHLFLIRAGVSSAVVLPVETSRRSRRSVPMSGPGGRWPQRSRARGRGWRVPRNRAGAQSGLPGRIGRLALCPRSRNPP